MFREEECQQSYNGEVFSRRLEPLLEDGIHGSLHGLSLRLLVCSDSQGRDQNAMFVVANSQLEKMDEMRKQIIPGGVKAFDGKPFMYMSRLGLFCTADFTQTLLFTTWAVENTRLSMTRSRTLGIPICSRMGLI